MNKQRLLSVLLSGSALLIAGSLAYAQAKPIKPLPNIPRPPSLKVPPGVELGSIAVKATCEKPSKVTVKVNYSKILSPDKVYLWGPLGQQALDIPTGTGVKTAEFTGPTLTCSGSNANWADVLQTAVFMGDTFVITPDGFDSTGTTATRQLQLRG